MSIDTPARTELAVPFHTGTLSAIVEQYATDLGHCAQFAEAVVDTPFVPAAFWPAPVIHRGDEAIALKASGRDAWDFRRRHPRESDDAFAWRRQNAIATTAAVIYSGAVLGLNWQAALSGIYVANGRTALYAEQMRALILAAGHRFEVLERGDETCTVGIARAGERDLTRFTFTMAEAVRAGYVKGKGPNTGEDRWKGNDRYNTNPADMLFARATSIGAKAKCPDVIRGMEARETIHDTQPVDITATVQDVTPPVPRRITAADLPRNVECTVPARSTETVDKAEPEPAEDTLDEGQWRAINAEFVALDVRGPGQTEKRLKVLSALLARPITRGTDLTRDEGVTVLDTLRGSGIEIISDILKPVIPDVEIVEDDDDNEDTAASVIVVEDLPTEPAGW